MLLLVLLPARDIAAHLHKDFGIGIDEGTIDAHAEASVVAAGEVDGPLLSILRDYAQRVSTRVPHRSLAHVEANAIALHYALIGANCKHGESMFFIWTK